jgi:hypothetical protein
VSWSQSSPRSRGRPLVVGRFGAGLVVPALARVILCEATLGVKGYREMLAAAEQRLPAARSPDVPRVRWSRVAGFTRLVGLGGASRTRSV